MLGTSVDLKAAEAMLLRLKHQTIDLRPVFHDVIDPSVSLFFEKQFATEGRHGGVKWAAHAKLTKKLRMRPGHGRGGILRDTNAMWSSFIKGSGPLAIRRIEKDVYERGSRDRKAGLHQTGWTSRVIFGRARKKAVKVPARPVVPKILPPSLVSTWEGAILNHITT